MSDKNRNSLINITCNPISYSASPKGRRSSQTRGNRLVNKSGKVHLRSSKVPQKRERFLADFFTSLIDAKWRWVIVLYSAGFILSWSLFGTAWFVIFWLRHRYDNGVVCVDNVDSWTSAFLFSVETQTTIGYGGRQVWKPYLHFMSFVGFKWAVHGMFTSSLGSAVLVLNLISTFQEVFDWKKRLNSGPVNGNFTLSCVNLSPISAFHKRGSFTLGWHVILWSDSSNTHSSHYNVQKREICHFNLS